MTDDKEICKKFSENLIRIRREKKFSRKQLADWLKITEVGFGRYETGERIPAIDKIFAIAEKLDCSITDLVGENKPSEQIFEYRFERAIDIIEAAHFNFGENADGSMVVSYPLKFEYDDATGIFSAYDGLRIITFKDKFSFVNGIEQIEKLALMKHKTFDSALEEYRKKITKK